MSSKYEHKVLKLLKKRFKAQVIHREHPLGDIAKAVQLPRELELDIDIAQANLNQMRLDFYVKGKLAVEVQGEQHELAVKFSNETTDPKAELERRKELDDIKRRVMLAAGIPLVCIWYNEVDELNELKLARKIGAAEKLVEEVVPEYKRIDRVPRGRKLGSFRRWAPARISNRTRAARPENENGESKLSRAWKRHKQSRSSSVGRRGKQSDV